MDRCPSCPGERSLRDFLFELTAEEDDDISYKKWTQTDGTKLETVTEDKEEFIESLVKQIGNLTKHHYIARCQSAYFSRCKSEVQSDSCVLVSDFSENFALVIQDAVQGYYWMTDHATLLPFMDYMKNTDGSVFNVSLCVISIHMITLLFPCLTLLIPVSWRLYSSEL